MTCGQSFISGLDFNSSVQEVVLVPGINSISVYIPITEDSISEREELFVLVLRLVKVYPPERTSEIYLNRNVTVAHIQGTFN